MKLFKKKYRVVKDDFGGYEVQVRFPFIPKWCQCWDTGNTNTFLSSVEARQFIEEKQRK